MSAPSRPGSGVAIVVAVTLTAVALGILIARFAPVESQPVRAATETRRAVRTLPSRLRQLVDDIRLRFDLAKSAFQTARVESERALVSQLQEAKERGSVPPL